MNTEGHRLLVPGWGPVILVPAWHVRPEWRRFACSRQEVSRLFSALATEGGAGDRLGLLALDAAIAGGGRHFSQDTTAAALNRLRDAVDQGTLFVFRGWRKPEARPVVGDRPRVSAPILDDATPAQRVRARQKQGLFEVTSLDLPSRLASGTETQGLDDPEWSSRHGDARLLRARGSLVGSGVCARR